MSMAQTNTSGMAQGRVAGRSAALMRASLAGSSPTQSNLIQPNPTLGGDKKSDGGSSLALWEWAKITERTQLDNYRNILLESRMTSFLRQNQGLKTNPILSLRSNPR
jgi:hypothetical protein